MADINERKTPREIKQKILEALNDRPLNAQEISKAISSNWSTVKNYVADLIIDKKVKKIVFGEKSIIYQKITGDTYFNIPLKDNDRNMLKFIFFNAIKEHKEITGKQIRRTDLAKLTDFVNCKLNLHLPIVWYIYGPMPLMIIDLQKNYSTEVLPKNAEEVKKTIKSWIIDKRRDKVKELIQECYDSSNERLYQIKLELFNRLEKNNNENIYEITREFYLTYLSYHKDESEIVERFYEVISGSDYLNFLEEPIVKNKILLAFDSIWRYIASKTLLKSLRVLGYEKETAELFMNLVIETKKYLAEESLKELEEVYNEKLPENFQESTVNKEANGILDKWRDSDVWRE